MTEFKKLKSPNIEEDVARCWKYTDNIYVSIVCLTYNHEKYIRDAIESFLAQKTEYRFEIIIHDDASTDATKEILDEYSKKYPLIIKCIFQTENQFSQGKKPSIIATSYANGEYIALCEGDDYWCDENKLQYQYSELSKRQYCDISFHPCYYLYPNNALELHNNISTELNVIALEKVVAGGGNFMPTASLMVRSEIFKNLPPWFDKVVAGDYFVQVFGSEAGGALFLPKPMCVYRKFSEGSWTSQVKRNSLRENIRSLNKRLKSYEFLENENPEIFHGPLAKVRATGYCNTASLCLSSKNFKAFQRLIIKSWNCNKNNSTTQILLYRLRKLPILALFLKQAWSNKWKYK